MSEILMILLIGVVLFGGTRLPQLGSSLGSAIRNFKKGFSGEEESDDSAPKITKGGIDAASESVKSSSKQA